jgi:hypothetical protein
MAGHLLSAKKKAQTIFDALARIVARLPSARMASGIRRHRQRFYCFRDALGDFGGGNP